MTRNELTNLQMKYSIVDVEIEDAIDFVRDLLEFQAEELKRNEPYATQTINRIESAAYVVGCLNDYIYEVEDN